jgi:hypothetical protein
MILPILVLILSIFCFCQKKVVTLQPKFDKYAQMGYLLCGKNKLNKQCAVAIHTSFSEYPYC